MALGKTINLAPTTEESSSYQTSNTVSTRDFKVLRRKVDGTTATLTVAQGEISLVASQISSLDGRVTNAEASITVNANNITLKANQSSLDNTNNRVTNAEAAITVNANAIATKVSTTDLATTLTNYSTTTQTSDAIATRVATTDYNGNTIASLINQTATTVAISASKINLSGYVTVSNLTDGVTTIDGGNIRTGTINADRITAGYLSAGSIGGWSIGPTTISRSGITLGAGNITLLGQGTDGPSLNFNYGGGSTRFYNYAQGWIAAQNSFRVDSTLRVIGDTTIDSDLVAGTGTFGYTITTFVRPSSNDLYDVGTSTYKYDDVYATNGTIQTSDLNAKTNIEDIANGVDLILNLRPVQFTYKDRVRTHYGFIAQWVKDSMTTSNINDAAVYVAPEEEGGYQGLRYTELIAPMVQTIQHLEKRIKDLENGN